jgi:class 3 adenylate cyclase/TolA-binding protein
VHALDGAPNKNIGDAFLLVWNLPDEMMDANDLFTLTETQPQAGASMAIGPQQSKQRRDEIRRITNATDREAAREEDQRAAEVNMLERARKAGASVPRVCRPINFAVQQHVSVLADKALVSFLRCHVALAASPAVAQFASHPRIQASFDHFVVSLGFGLHVGWSVEGPIGSRHKIDASYLSPHVTLSETLQDCTKLYGMPILMSGEFVALLSPYVRSFCRRLDVIRVSGREAPVNLYGFDVHGTSLRQILNDEMPTGYDPSPHIKVLACKPHMGSGSGSVPDLDSDAPPSRATAELSDLRELLQNPFMRAIPPQQREQSSNTDSDEQKDSNNKSSENSSSISIENDAPEVPSLVTDLNVGDSPVVAAADVPAVGVSESNSTTNPSASSSSTFSVDANTSNALLAAATLRQRMHASSPIASFHLVHNYRLSALQASIPHAFFAAYTLALDLYLAGEWKKAEPALKHALQLYPEDVPTQLLLDRIVKLHKRTVPLGWTGCTAL